MTQLAIAAPKKRGIGPLMTGTVAQESVSVNKWNLEALSVNEKHISPASISTEKLVIGSVTAVTIADGTITGDKVAAATITGNKVAANTIEGTNIAADAITAGLIDVSTLSAISANLGTITAGTLNLVSGTTGIYISPTQILAKVSGTTKLDFNVTGGTYYVAGEILADKITITSNAANSVNFGTDITIGGDIIMNASAVDGRLYFDGSAGNKYIDYDAVFGTITAFGLIDTDSTSDDIIGMAQGSSSWTTLMSCPYVAIQAGNLTINTSGASGPNPTTRDLRLNIGTNSGNAFAVQRGGTDVISFVGNSNTVTFAGAIAVSGSVTGVTTLTASGNITAGAGADYVVTGPNATTPLKINQKLLSVSVTGTGNFGTGTWTHGWDTSAEFVSFSATLMDFDTTKSTGISNVRVERTSATTCKVEFLVATYVSTQTIYVDVIAVGPV